MGKANRLGLALAGLVVVMALFSAGSRLITVHQQTSDWALWPRAVPSKVQFADRDYSCGREAKLAVAADDGGLGPGDAALQGLTVRGKTAGGADIYASAAAVPPVIKVLADEGVYGCTLMGGP
jgi:hypothetical protein